MISSDFYQREELLSHAKKPRNQGRIKGAQIVCADRNPLCGDIVEITARVKQNRMVAIKFFGSGCLMSQAAASLLTEKMVGRRLDEVLALDENSAEKILGAKVTAARLKCVALPLRVLQEGIRKYLNKNK